MCRRLFAAIFMAGVTAFPAIAADAPGADKPTPQVGDVFEYAKGFVTITCARWEVTEVGKDGFTILQCGDNRAYIDAATDTLSKIVGPSDKRLIEFKPRSPTLDFPLALGKKWTGEYEGYRADTGATWKSTVSCEAKSFEPVKVPAGEFEAYRIDCADAWESFPFRGVSDSSVWYAPKPGTVVKSVNPTQSAFDYELAAYHVK